VDLGTGRDFSNLRLRLDDFVGRAGHRIVERRVNHRAAAERRSVGDEAFLQMMVQVMRCRHVDRRHQGHADQFRDVGNELDLDVLVDLGLERGAQKAIQADGAGAPILLVTLADARGDGVPGEIGADLDHRPDRQSVRLQDCRIDMGEAPACHIGQLGFEPVDAQLDRHCRISRFLCGGFFTPRRGHRRCRARHAYSW
jgi:hypothetical protein